MGDQLSIGNVDIRCLTDTSTPFPIPLTSLFPGTTDEEWEPFKERYPAVFTADGFSHTHVGSYLVRTGGRTLLVDTGIGPGPVEMFGGVKGNLPGDMAAKGVDPDDIDMVVHTHLHFDHISWNIAEDGTPRFTNARYVCSQVDWDYFQKPEVQANFPPNSFEGPMRPLESAGVLELVQGEQALTEELTMIPTPGHTPGHMSLLISSGGEKAIITGDVFINPAQITNPGWSAAFDSDASVASATRQSVMNRIEAEGLKTIACHFPSPGFGDIVRIEGKRYWQGA